MFIVIVHCCRYSIHYKIQCSNMKSETIHNHTHRRSNTIVPQSFDLLSFGPPNPMDQIMSICSIWFVPPNQMNQMASIWSSIWFDGPNQMDQMAFIWSSFWFGGPNQMDQTTSFWPFEFGGPNQMKGAKCAFDLFHQTQWIKWRPFDPPFGHLFFWTAKYKQTKWHPFDPPFGHLVFGPPKTNGQMTNQMNPFDPFVFGGQMVKNKYIYENQINIKSNK